MLLDSFLEEHLHDFGVTHCQLLQDSVLLFCRKGIYGKWYPFVYLGRLTQPEVNWSKGQSGTFQWTLQVHLHTLVMPSDPLSCHFFPSSKVTTAFCNTISNLRCD